MQSENQWRTELLKNDPRLKPILDFLGNKKPSQTHNDTEPWLWASDNLRRSQTPPQGPSGKWLIRAEIANGDLDCCWAVVSAAVAIGVLGDCAKVSAGLGASRNPGMLSSSGGHQQQQQQKTGVVIVYTHDSDADSYRVLAALRSLGFKRQLFYKTDESTNKGLYGKDAPKDKRSQAENQRGTEKSRAWFQDAELLNPAVDKLVEVANDLKTLGAAAGGGGGGGQQQRAPAVAPFSGSGRTLGGGAPVQQSTKNTSSSCNANATSSKAVAAAITGNSSSHRLGSTGGAGAVAGAAVRRHRVEDGSGAQQQQPPQPQPPAPTQQSMREMMAAAAALRMKKQQAEDQEAR